MSCPHLKEIRMVMCRAYPVKKPVPSDRVATTNTCESGFESCPLYREALARAEGADGTGTTEFPNAAPKGATP